MDTKIIWFLKDQAAPVSMNQIVKGVGGIAEIVRAPVKVLAEDDSQPVTAVTGGAFVRYAYDASKHEVDALPVL